MKKTTKAYLYKWTQISTGRWYRGSRTRKGCYPDDGYISHSKIINPLIAANPSDWVREIECIGEPKYIADLETKWLTYLKAKQDLMSYNEVNHWPACGVVGKPSPKKGKPSGKKGIPSGRKGEKRGPQKAICTDGEAANVLARELIDIGCEITG